MKSPILLLQILALAVLIALFQRYLVHAQQPQTGVLLRHAFAAPRLNAKQATELARQYTGFSEASVSRVTYGKASDMTHPVMTVRNRPVWQVIFTAGAERGLAIHRTISTFAVVIDDRSGALLKIATPVFFRRGISTDERMDELGPSWENEELHLLETTTVPSLPLNAVLAKIRNVSMPYCSSGERPILPMAREIAAYYGVNDGDTQGTMRGLPLWIIDLSGFTVTGVNPINGKEYHCNSLRVVIDARNGRGF